ncbi:xanthine dehydrogenase family protein molybdopterin-binding subunit [Bacteroidota bacterium]
MNKNFNYVGKKINRQDGFNKVTGLAKFADDYSFDNELYGVMLRLPVAHAIIKSIDYSDLHDNPNLIAVVDSNDIPGEKLVGLIRKDQPIFSYKKVLSPGDVLAMLVGEDRDILTKLRNNIKIEYKSLPVISDPAKSLDKNTPLIHSEFKSNLIVHHPLRRGDIEEGFSKSDYIIEKKFTTPHIEHAYLEPETVTAIPEENSIKIIGSIQNPHSTRKIVASVLGWPLVRVRIIQAELGGSFGGKDDIMSILSSRAAIGAIKTNRPVKIKYSREESIEESYKRHAYVMNYKVGFRNDGKLIAMKVNILADGGAYSSMTPFVTWRTLVQATGPYEIENVWIDVKGVYTNNTYTGAMRGFGSPQPIFGQESIMDEIAIKLGMSPFEIRKVNGFRKGSVTATGQKLEGKDINLLKVLKTAVNKTDFSQKWTRNLRNNTKCKSTFIRELEDRSSFILNKDFFVDNDIKLRKGIGLALSFRGCSLGAEGADAVATYLSVQRDGTVYLLSGLAENGQGLRTTFSIIAAEVLGITPDKILYLEQDTHIIPDSGPTVASRSTLMGGNSVKKAAETIKKRLKRLCVTYYKLNSYDQVSMKDNYVCAGSQKITFNDLCEIAYSESTNLSIMGWYTVKETTWNEADGQGTAYFTFVYGCQVAEIVINVTTGEIFIERIFAVHDPGKIINLLGARGQVYGGVTQGSGYALLEEISHENGFVRELNFDQYYIPTIKDIGKIDIEFIEGKDKYGPWGAKSLGEPTLELTSAAIANAVRNALGERFYNLPLNLEEILLKRKLRPGVKSRGSKS